MLSGVNVPRTVGLVFVALGVAGMAAGLVLPWARSGGLHPDGATIAGIVLLGPLLSAARLAFDRFVPHGTTQRPGAPAALGRARSGWTAPSVAAAIAALAAALIAAANARQVEPSAGIGLGGPLTVAAALTAAAGWLLIIMRVPERPIPRPVLVMAGAIALLLALDGSGIYWAVEGRFVDTTTTAAAASAPTTEPKLDAERWHRTGLGSAMIGLGDPQVLVRDVSGVRAYAAQTGKPTWHYLRSDGTALATGVVGDAVVTVFGTGEGVLITAHETATGSERFSRRYARKSWHPISVVSTVHGQAAVLVGGGPDAGDVVALDAHTGDVRWTWRPERDGGPCDIAGVGPGEDTIGLALRCRATGVNDVAIGLSTADGRERWSWRAAYSSDIPRAEELAMRASGSGFLVEYGAAPRHAILLAGSSGDPGTDLRTNGIGSAVLATIVDTTALYYLAGVDGAEVIAVDARTGTAGWRVQLPSSIGWRLVAATATPAKAYLLLSTRQPETASGPLRVVALDKETGSAAGDHLLSCDISCTQSTIAAGTQSVVVASPNPRATTLNLVALA
jgi:outer membrane protein assembly factor BamB